MVELQALRMAQARHDGLGQVCPPHPSGMRQQKPHQGTTQRHLLALRDVSVLVLMLPRQLQGMLPAQGWFLARPLVATYRHPSTAVASQLPHV